MSIKSFLKAIIPLDFNPTDHNPNNRFIGIYEVQAVINKVFGLKKDFTRQMEAYQRLHNNRKITEKQYAEAMLKHIRLYQQELLFAENQILHILKN